MTVFHGSNADFSAVSPAFAKDKRDFGRGFYTTTIREQAASWAENMCRRYKTKTAYLYEFEFSLHGLTVKTFDAMTKAWLDSIFENRLRGGIQHTFDVVIGPAANDRTVNTLNLYISRELTLEEALNRLTYIQANNQVSIHTERALNNLVFVRRERWKL
jgi:hypothetical protein